MEENMLGASSERTLLVLAEHRALTVADVPTHLTPFTDLVVSYLNVRLYSYFPGIETTWNAELPWPEVPKLILPLLTPFVLYHVPATPINAQAYHGSVVLS